MASEHSYPTSTSTLEDCPTPHLPHRHPPPHPASTTKGHRGVMGVFLKACVGKAEPAGWTQPSSQVGPSTCPGAVGLSRNKTIIFKKLVADSREYFNRDGACTVLQTPCRQIQKLKVKAYTTPNLDSYAVLWHFYNILTLCQQDYPSNHKHNLH